MKLCAVIPVYNHSQVIGKIVRSLVEQQLPCILVDDGSEIHCTQVLVELSQQSPTMVTLIRLPINQGKGGAVIAGFQSALANGYTHVLQIDADGQHAVEDVPRFIEQSLLHPESLICGCPLYDDSVPKARFYGRYATHIWVWINTLSFSIRDSMCGFRIYPLHPTVKLINQINIGRRMNFDIEILVRLYWRGMQIINQPTRVKYPEDGISHFRIGLDNWLISLMHTKLFFGMLLRIPALLWRKIR